MTDLAIKAAELSRKFDDFWAVKDLNLEVPTGAVFGLLGENGAGKSTTLQMLMGLLLPSAGTIDVLGLDPCKDDVAVKTRVGYVAEHHGFYENMSVDGTINMLAAYHKTWNDELREELQSDFALDGATRVSSLSKGMRAKLALLLALAFEPDVLILDEPAGGLDPAARRKFIETILARFQESGRTILLSSHLLNDFAGLLDHVAFIQSGSVAMTSSVEALHATTKRVQLTFDHGTPEQLRFANALSQTVNGREASAIVAAYDEDRTLAEIREFNPSKYVVNDVTLEEIFVARAAQ